MSDKSKKVVTRFAPSPTGYLHIGAARTALFNWLFARQNKGTFILRIEDTDKERSRKEYEEDILESLKWLGFAWDEMYRQSERTEIYKKYLERMIAEDKAYVSFEEEGPIPYTEEGGKDRHEGTMAAREKRGSAAVLRDEVIRFKNPNKKVKFKDTILGEIEFDTTELGDFVIAKDLETPLYNFTVVVDDHEMGITHVIRGQDHISNTPRQILIGEALGFKAPQYVHLPLILARDRSKLSKRHGVVSVLEFRKWGYLPEAMANFIALIGWNPGDDQEIFSLSELVQKFSLDKIQKGGAIFDTEKLDFINRQHMKQLPQKIVIDNVMKMFEVHDLRPKDKDIVKKLIPTILDRISKWSDIERMVEEGEMQYFFESPDYDPKDLVWKGKEKKPSSAPASAKATAGKKASEGQAKEHLEKLQILLQPIAEDQFTEIIVKEALWNYADEKGRGEVLWPMRFALSGRDKSPDPFTLAEVLGKEETLKRIKKAFDKL
ncbi:glutamate--tRNA ligase [Candidatus Nomurabacteria bacterium RIFCSPHIGHO2_01_FULL_42_16]|uniref:Glutamate--tRNA ligase n=1 Tax=Candidatus Nomurabacteria bacterium RIFCSPHIGHO2_01_FULL_42_16 TaxID=1801743 RepID=A0A1F6VH34_9BACT|nr:MAG: glutamate--tRNA ligase [Candidatus Nomurabacteria bacterium RIFCSPHIGHO2_01_FULL_42_16]